MNLRELLVGDAAQLRHVFRWGTVPTVRPENIAEHSYYVALYCYCIWRWGKLSYEDWPVDLGSLLAKAVLHDLEEAVTTDLPRHVKHRPDLKTAFNDVGEDLCYEMLKKIYPQVSSQHPGTTIEHVREESTYYRWKKAKSDACGTIVVFADFLAALSYVISEAQRGNRTLYLRCLPFEDHFKEFSDKRFDFIRPLVQQCEPILAELRSGEGAFLP